MEYNVREQKKLGGLGSGGVANRNLAMLGKWHLRFPEEQDSLWASIVHGHMGLA